LKYAFIAVVNLLAIQQWRSLLTINNRILFACYVDNCVICVDATTSWQLTIITCSKLYKWLQKIHHAVLGEKLLSSLLRIVLCS